MTTITPTYTVPTAGSSLAPTDTVAPAGRGWTRAGIIAGVLGVATFVVAGGVFAGEDALIDNARVVEEIKDSAAIVHAYQILGVASAAALVLFAVGLKRRLEQQEPAGSLTPSVASAGLFLTAALCLVGSGICTELFWFLQNADKSDPDAIVSNLEIFNTMGWVWAGAGLTTGAVAVAARRGSVSRGLGRVSIAATVLIALTQILPFQYLALVPASLWLLAAGIGFGRAERAGA